MNFREETAPNIDLIHLVTEYPRTRNCFLPLWVLCLGAFLPLEVSVPDEVSDSRNKLSKSLFYQDDGCFYN